MVTGSGSEGGRDLQRLSLGLGPFTLPLPAIRAGN